MFSIIEAAGWPIWPLITASVISLAIIAERMWFLRTSSILPNGLSQQLLSEYLQKQITPSKLEKLAQDSPMGHVLATVIKNIGASAADLK
ncbi:MAG: MotA/TolQ/ExbB proton channel family protein, partial [Betaproteobacteria bacterium]